MITVKLTTNSPEIPLIRQTPGSKGIWGDCRFVVDEPLEKADWWVVLDTFSTTQKTVCAPENTLLITQETEFIKKYDERFINQFAHVITCQRNMQHPGKIYTQQAHLWHVGWFGTGSGVDPKDFKKMFTTYDQLKAITHIEKTKTLSNVTSYKQRTAGQADRREFIAQMKEHFKDRFDVYGAGINYIRDKWDGIAPYKYYLAIDNSFVEDYWTTNLGDAYLAGAYPFYYGHPSVFKYFSKNALTMIDIHDIPGSIAIIEKAIKENYYEKHLNDIWEARSLVLDKYNLFALIAETIHSLPQGKTPKQLVLLPDKQPGDTRKKIIGAIKHVPLLYPLAQTIYRSYRTATKKPTRDPVEEAWLNRVRQGKH